MSGEGIELSVRVGDRARCQRGERTRLCFFFFFFFLVASVFCCVVSFIVRDVYFFNGIAACYFGCYSLYVAFWFLSNLLSASPSQTHLIWPPSTFCDPHDCSSTSCIWSNPPEEKRVSRAFNVCDHPISPGREERKLTDLEEL